MEEAYLLTLYIRKGVRWLVGNGNKIDFWSDNWVCPYPISNFSPFGGGGGSEDMKVSEVINYFDQWDVAQLSSLVPCDI